MLTRSSTDSAPGSLSQGRCTVSRAPSTEGWENADFENRCFGSFRLCRSTFDTMYIMHLKMCRARRILDRGSSSETTLDFYSPVDPQVVCLKPEPLGGHLWFNRWTLRYWRSPAWAKASLRARWNSLDGWMLWNSPLHPSFPLGALLMPRGLRFKLLNPRGYIKVVSLFIKQRFDLARGPRKLFIGLVMSNPAASDKYGLLWSFFQPS